MASAQQDDLLDDVEMAAAEVFDPSLRRKRKATEEDPVLLEDLQRLTSVDAMAPVVRKEGGTLSDSVGRDHSILWWASPDGKIQFQIRNRANQLDSVEDFPAHGVFDSATGRVLVLTWYRKEIEHRDPKKGPAQIWFNYHHIPALYGQFLKDGEHVPLTLALAMEWSDPRKARALYAKYPGIGQFNLLFGHEEWSVFWSIYLGQTAGQIAGYYSMLLNNEIEYSFKGLPAVREWRPDWTLSKEEWRDEEEGDRHRDFAVGPAVIEYDEDGNVTNEEYWYEGEQETDPGRVRQIILHGVAGRRRGMLGSGFPSATM